MTSDAKPKWKKRWGYELSQTPIKPGVWRAKVGGYLVRARAKDKKTGKLVEIKRLLKDCKSAADAAAELARLLAERREGPASAPKLIRWHEYVAQWTERKIASGDLRSPHAANVLGYEVQHLLTNELSDVLMDQLRAADFLRWRAAVAELVAAGTYSPNTANNWVKRARQICRDATEELELGRNLIAMLKAFDTSEHRTYTRSQPNSLTGGDLGEFCAAVRRVAPAYFAAVVLGFSTGLRPSSIRPLRRQGPDADILWEEGRMLVRRSYVYGRILDRTKTGADQEIALPEAMMEVLREHVASLPARFADNELLFPSVSTGGLIDKGTLQYFYRKALKELGWTDRWLTPRAMRRTFQDSTRAAAVKDLVTRSISGHQTPSEQIRYSTVKDQEQRDAIAAALRPTLVVLQGGRGGADDGSLGSTLPPVSSVK